MRKHETYEEEYEEYDLPTEPQDEPEDPQATIEQTVVNGHCISIEKFFDGFSVGDYVKSPSGPANRGRERKLRKLSNPRTSLQPLWVALD